MNPGSDPRRTLGAFATVLSYPGDGYGEAAAVCAATLDGAVPQAHLLMTAFARTIVAMEPWQREELFTRTFDLNPVCSIEVGWHLHGETYERGAFLVRCREALRAHGIGESGELPDHLSHVLPMLARMEDGEARSFGPQVARAVRKMAEGFAERDNPYGDVIEALRLTLAAAFGELEKGLPTSSAAPFPPRDACGLRGEIS